MRGKIIQALRATWALMSRDSDHEDRTQSGSLLAMVAAQAPSDESGDAAQEFAVDLVGLAHIRGYIFGKAPFPTLSSGYLIEINRLATLLHKYSMAHSFLN